MTAQILSVTLFVLLAIGGAFPQAATEWGLLNANSAVAAGKTATVYGNRLSRSTKNIAKQIPTVRQPKAEVHRGRHVTQSAPAFSRAAGPSARSMIVSIQRGRATHSSLHPNPPPASQRSFPN